jgi:hypothetical protein
VLVGDPRTGLTLAKGERGQRLVTRGAHPHAPTRRTPRQPLSSAVANATRWAAEPDRQAATAPARAAFNDRFLREARERFGDLPADELAWRAERLRRAHFAKLALKSAQPGRTMTFDPTNVQPLCHACHSRKTAAEVFHR